MRASKDMRFIDNSISKGTIGNREIRGISLCNFGVFGILEIGILDFVHSSLFILHCSLFIVHFRFTLITTIFVE